MVEEKRKELLDDIGNLFDASKSRLVKIQVDGDSETTTGPNQRTEMSFR